MERFEHFAFDEVVNEESRQLEPKTRYLVVLAALIGCQGEAAYREILPKSAGSGIVSRRCKGNGLSGSGLSRNGANVAILKKPQMKFCGE